MNHLIIYSHPNQNSYTLAVVNRIIAHAEENSEMIKLIDLYGEKFQPILTTSDFDPIVSEDVLAHQKLLTWCDKLTIVAPLWWGHLPAIFKGYFDRVLTAGFAFNYVNEQSEGLLNHIKAHIIINTGAPNKMYQENGMHDALKTILIDNTFAFCGMDARISFLGNINNSSTLEERQALLERVCQM